MNHTMRLLVVIALLVIIELSQALLKTVGSRPSKRILRLSSLSDDEDNRFWSENVEYVDLTSSIEPPSAGVRDLPLFLLGGAFFPQGNTFLHVFEMKYRTMMFDLSQADDLFGYIHTDGGQIASIGTLCKITRRQLLDDGRQYIELEGVGRFKVRKIVRTLPYVVAEVEPNIIDHTPSDPKAAAACELEVYNNLKLYMRLMKCFNPDKEIVITAKAKLYAPSKFVDKSNNQRRSDFSFSLANMIQMASGRESQLLLQTRDVTKRLQAQKMILRQAVSIISEQAVKAGVVTDSALDEMRERSFYDEQDADILPVSSSVEELKAEKDEWDISNIE